MPNLELGSDLPYSRLRPATVSMMEIQINLASGTFWVDINHPLDISIPLRFNQPHPNCWGAGRAIAHTFSADGFIGDTRRGGSCNVEEYHFTPHCHGTHTECIGHISKERIEICNWVKDSFILSTLVTVIPCSALDIEDGYLPNKQPTDKMISKASLVNQLNDVNPEFLTALIIRTQPNDDSKLTRDYLNDFPPFLSLDAIEYIVDLNVKHLLVDMPSVDRVFDEGYLSVHRTFWGMPLGEFNIDAARFPFKTISEMIYVQNTIPDGYYLLNLQLPSFATDAAPSRPVLYSCSRERVSAHSFSLVN